jgi:probable HAF family extracellular repeat protein
MHWRKFFMTHPGQLLCMKASLALLILVGASGAPAFGQTYNVCDLGTLGGSYSIAYSTNALNQIVGMSTTNAGQSHAFFWQDGIMSDLGTLGGSFSAAFGINASGQVVGWAANAQGKNHAFRLDLNGSMVDLGTLGGRTSYAYGINDWGAVVGGAATPDGPFHAFVVRERGLRDIGTLAGGSDSYARAINGHLVTGWSSTTQFGDTHAFRYEGRAMIDLGVLEGGQFSTGGGIDAGGRVVGESSTTGGIHAALWNETGGHDLGNLGVSSQAVSINSSGVAVGGAGAPGLGVRATIYQDGSITDLNSLIPSKSGWTLTFAYSINDAGSIVGYGLSPNGDTHAFLLVPISAPVPPSNTHQSSPPRAARLPISSAGFLLVANSDNSILRFDEITGSCIDVFVRPGSGGLSGTGSLLFGPDQNLYVASSNNNSILRYDGTTGKFIDAFVPNGSGGLVSPFGMIFGYDGNLYVTSGGISAPAANSRILRFDGHTGAFIDVFVAANQFMGPRGVVFGPDGNLYVNARGPGPVVRFDGSTGEFLDIFARYEFAGDTVPRGLVFGPDNSLYVSSLPSLHASVLRYDRDGDFINPFVPEGSAGLVSPTGPLFGPDGNLYVRTDPGATASGILRFDGTTGEPIDDFIPLGTCGLRSNRAFTFRNTDPITLAYVR